METLHGVGVVEGSCEGRRECRGDKNGGNECGIASETHDEMVIDVAREGGGVQADVPVEVGGGR